VIVFSLSGPLAREVVVAIVDGRGRMLDAAPAEPSVVLNMTTETFARLGCGRIDPVATVADGDVTFVGDATLGQRVVDAMNYLF
jgi:putative sterol carrier protein